jgi:DNA invertase Pin-like site-specific DNA recombinase
MRAIAYFDINRGGVFEVPGSSEYFTQAFETYCAGRNHVPYGVFTEEKGVIDSAKYLEMVTMIKASGLGFLVVIPSASHLGLSIIDQADRILELDSLSCQVICDDDEFPDPLQNGFKAIGKLNGSRSERILEGMRAKAARALGLGKSPFGYRIDFEGVFRVVPEEAEVVRLMFQMYLDERIGVRTIANRLNQRRIRTRKGARWSMVTVRDILRNHAYIGTYQRFGLRIPSSYEPIVSADDFKQAQDIMLSRSSSRTRQKNTPFLLAGILYCGYCEQRMVGVTRNQSWELKGGGRASTSYRYYQCQTRINRNQCKYRTMKAPQLEEAVLTALRARDQSSVTFIPADSSLLVSQRRQLESLLEGVDRRYVEFIQRAATGTLSLHQLRSVRHDIDTYKQQIHQRLSRIMGNSIDIDEIIHKFWLRLGSFWEETDIYEQRDVLSMLVSRINVKSGKISIEARV